MRVGRNGLLQTSLLPICWRNDQQQLLFDLFSDCNAFPCPGCHLGAESTCGWGSKALPQTS